MTEKNLYPQAEISPSAPPKYDSTPVYPQPLPSSTIPPSLYPQQNVYNVPGQTLPLGPQSCRVTCPSCQQAIMTKMEYVNSTKTHLIALVLGLTTCCCCIPYCVNSCKSAQHLCPNCGAYLGTYNN